jgi:hypothetical protein
MKMRPVDRVDIPQQALSREQQSPKIFNICKSMQIKKMNQNEDGGEMMI